MLLLAHRGLRDRIEHTHGHIKSHATARWFRESLDAGTQLTTADVSTLAFGAGLTTPEVVQERRLPR